MLSHLPRLAVVDLRTSLFGTALLGLVLGFGVFFDHLADLNDPQPPDRRQAIVELQAVPPLLRLAWRSEQDVQKLPATAPPAAGAPAEALAPAWRARAAAAPRAHQGSSL